MEMSRINETQADEIAASPSRKTLPDRGLEAFHSFHADRESMVEVLLDIQAIGGDRIARKIDQLIHELRACAPSITMIGQIKSGKTTLVNAMTATPDLLPADVNPWTSVVTSLHMGVKLPDEAPRAAFRFFDADEWDRLVKGGGRIGELAGRTGAEAEAEKLRAQVEQMREKTRERLGKRFELMLGQTHDYARFDDALIKRYVCMGDDFDELSQAEKQGQFADITRSADLWLEDASLPVPLTIRDTPGVNDTFMMREQITIRALRDSRTCVVVLSAHQALSSTDMGLIRLISNMKSREVVIFVNRIDELADPVTQVAEIRASLIDTLSANDGPSDPQIVFGSAYWANAVLNGTLDDLPEDSANALHAYAAHKLGGGAATMGPDGMVWQLSGLPELYSAVGERLAAGPWAQMLDSIRARAANYVAGLRASSQIVTLRSGEGAQLKRVSDEEATKMFDQVARTTREHLQDGLAADFAKFAERVDQVHERFVERALDSLLGHLEEHGEGSVWSYSPDGLRVLMRSAHQVMRRNVTKTGTTAFKLAARQLTDIYGHIFDVEATNFAVAAPDMPDIPPPVTLAQTIALDVKTSWWKGWWGKRRGYRAFAKDFRALIEAETAPMVDELKVKQADEIRGLAMGRLEEFIAEQRDVLADIGAKADISIEELHGLFGITAQEEREMLFEMLFEELGIDEDAFEGERA
ncbi:dynamin family protein [Jannaschia aquimarina]|uniref:Der_1 protein n=1 Tax=Jannaschia aquimarina TaxID=935700 RepID=A0A0D1CKJ8_9RHOB|nr:dynamin family protein [Jannaschia aquimarina]KIT15277.1 GTPase Der [Jannaschia aquimarina]SNT25493.1 Dynamin family protein [Jannaschia aquimarina]